MAEDIPQNLILFPPRKAWLDAGPKEEILEPGLPIIDAHHHMWDIPGFWRYLFDDLREDIYSGHNIAGTVFIEAHAFWRADGPDHLKSLGETEFVNGVAAMSASGIYGPTKFCAAIVGNADLTRGAGVREILDKHIAAAGGPEGRFRGVRHNAQYTDEPYYTSVKGVPGVMQDAKFREGVKELGKANLAWDTWIYQTQLGELAELARAVPDTKIVLNHVGAPLRNGRFGKDLDTSFRQWREGMLALGKCENVYVKIGGLGLRFCGFDIHALPAAPGSQYLADLWKPYVETSIEAFGPNRSMFESDWPVEKDGCSYANLWNAFKRLTAGASAAEKTALYSGTAAHVYRLSV